MKIEKTQDRIKFASFLRIACIASFSLATLHGPAYPQQTITPSSIEECRMQILEYEDLADTVRLSRGSEKAQRSYLEIGLECATQQNLNDEITRTLMGEIARSYEREAKLQSSKAMRDTIYANAAKFFEDLKQTKFAGHFNTLAKK